jgi:4-hydroxybenzoate polyprenyltransferase
MPEIASRVSWRDLLVVHRLQFPLPVNYVCYAVWGCGLATGDAARLLRPETLLSIAINLLLIIASLALNVAIDLPTDVRHREKGYIAGAAGRLGRVPLLVISCSETVLGLLMAVFLGTVWQRWPPFVIAAVIVVAQLLYNLEPIHLKRRGLSGSMVFGIASVGLPAMLGYLTQGARIGASAGLILAGTSVVSIGRTVWWAIPDYAADTATGIRTPVVRFGPVRALDLACGLLLVGLCLLGWGLWLRYGRSWTVVGLAAHVVFFGYTVRQLAESRRGRFPNARRMLTRTLPIATLGEVLLTITMFVG